MTNYEVVLKPAAIRDLDAFRKYDAACIADGIEKHLSFEPTKESKSRIKRFRGIDNPDYRLRIGEFRVFYTVDESAREVDVLRVMHKDETARYYEEMRP
ncbi:type II toxin-antitoxin system RelE/ParE family toxin [Candidatus Sumerlaeota bacterium]|nr:type II toxin-antitoxin system RelE/ParE family toxin [Candidatus Sumerlaeota bacterium]